MRTPSIPIGAQASPRGCTAPTSSRRVRRFLMGLLVSLWAVVWSSPPAAAQNPAMPQTLSSVAASAPADQAPRIDVSLHADAAVLAPGQTLWFGVRLAIETGWHVYWRNPGDAGMPTSLRGSAPEGWRWSEPRWPAPQRFHDASGLLGYGYENEFVLLIALTPPDDVAPMPLAQAPITLGVQWLACRDRCVLGEAALDVQTLAAGGGGQGFGSEADIQLIDQWRQRVPRDVNADPLVRDVRTQTLDTSGALTQRVLVAAIVDWADQISDAAWYPDLLPDAEVVDVVVTTAGRQTRIEAAVTGLPQRFRGYRVLPGVLVYQRPDGQRRAVQVALEMNTADVASELRGDDEREQP